MELVQFYQIIDVHHMNFRELTNSMGLPGSSADEVTCNGDPRWILDGKVLLEKG